MHTGSKHFYEFGPFQIDVTERRLLRNGAPQRLTPKVFDILLALAAKSGHMLGKDDLIKAVWPNTVVEENNLTQNISVLRKVLGEEDYIETVPRCGYRFTAQVVERWEELPGLVVRQSPQPNVAMAEEQGAGELAPVQAKEVEPTVPARRGVRTFGRAPACLRWVLAGATVTFLGVVGFAISGSINFRRAAPVKPPAGPPPIPSLAQGEYVAVLPFQVLGDQSSLGYAAEGLRDAVAARLLLVKDIHVIPFATVESAGKNASLEEWARKLGANLVVQGTVQGTPDKMRVGISIEDMSRELPLWSSIFSGASAELPRLEDQVTTDLGTALTLAPETVEEPSGPPASVQNARIERHHPRVRTRRQHPASLVVATMAPAIPDGYFQAPSLAARPVESSNPALDEAVQKSGGQLSWARSRIKASTGWIPALWHKIDKKKQSTTATGM